MAKVFFKVYKYISKKRKPSFIFLLLFLAGALLLASQIRLEENIINIIPRDTQVKEVNKVFEGLKINNRLVFHIYYADSSISHPDQLVSIADNLSDSLLKKYPEYIDEVVKEIPDSQMQKMYNYYYNNLPFYLLPKDYEEINNRIVEESVNMSIGRIYKQLLSPVGFVTKMTIKDPLGFTGFPLQRMRDLQLDNNFDLYQNHIVTKNLKHLIFFTVLSNPPNETAHNGELIEGVNKYIDRIEDSDKGVKVAYFGPAAVAVANASRIKKDIYLTVTLALVALFAFISFFYKNAGVFFIVVTPGIFGAIVAIAFLYLIKDSVSVISLGVGSVLLGITIDYALHFFTHFKKEQDIETLFKDLTGPLLMSSFTTGCAFFSLIFIRSSALQDLGIFAGISVIAAVFYTLIILPHVISKIGKGKAKTDIKENFIERLVSWFANYPFHKKKWAIFLLVILSLASLYSWKKVTFESNMLELNYMPKHLEENQEGINAISNISANNIYVAFRGSNLSQALDANNKLYQELKELKRQGEIYDYSTINSLIPSPDLQQTRLEEWKNFWQKHSIDTLVRNINSTAAGYGFENEAFSEFKDVLVRKYDSISQRDINTILSVLGDDLIINNEDGSVSVVSAIILSAKAKSDVLKHIASLPGSIILDKGYLTSKLIELLREDFAKLVNISLMVVFFIILISYGRLELALIAFIPILISWLWVLGLMGWLGLSFNIINIIVCTFIFGLGIDYSIFVMRGLTQNYAFGIDNLRSYKKSIILSVVTTLLGIGVLACARHPALQSIAFLAIIGILSVVFITFTVEHILYNWLILKRKKKKVIPFTLASLFLSLLAFSLFLFGCIILFFVRLIYIIPWTSLERRQYSYHKFIRFFCQLVIYTMANLKKDIIDRENIDFDRPSVIISNHQSFIDILLLLMLHPKLVMITNDWVYNSPLFGKSLQFGGFIQASKGLESQFEKIQKLIHQGYSIIVFPEGTRSRTAKIGRMHKGAFFLAEQFNLDMQPVILHGTNYNMPRGDDFYLKSGKVTLKFLPRIRHDDLAFGTTYRERSKEIGKYFKAEYQKMRYKLEDPDFFKEIIMKNYIYKGPVLEWYIRIKYKLEEGYRIFHHEVPKKGRIVDLGCGYGPMTYALCLSGEGREILGIDYDSEKIRIAQNCPVRPPNSQFIYADALDFNFGSADVFIISDVLHYLTPQEQQELLNKIVKNLRPDGKVIIRDGDTSKKQQHRRTELTEFFSVGSGFNKSRNQLNYISTDLIMNFAQNNNFKMKIIDNSIRTSDTIFVLTQN